MKAWDGCKNQNRLTEKWEGRQSRCKSMGQKGWPSSEKRFEWVFLQAEGPGRGQRPRCSSYGVWTNSEAEPHFHFVLTAWVSVPRHPGERQRGNLDSTASTGNNRLGAAQSRRPAPGRPPSRPLIAAPDSQSLRVFRPPWLLAAAAPPGPAPYSLHLTNLLTGYGCGIAGFLGWPEVTRSPSSAAITLNCRAQSANNEDPKQDGGEPGALEQPGSDPGRAGAEEFALSTSWPPGYTSVLIFTCCAAASPIDARGLSQTAQA